MAEKELTPPAAAEPRLAAMARSVGGVKIQSDKFNAVMDFDDVMAEDTRGMNRARTGRRAIQDTYGAPGFRDNGHGKAVEPINPQEPEEPRTMGEAMADNPILKRYDCTHGCNGKETVQPVNSTGLDWECSECGKAYKPKGN